MTMLLERGRVCLINPPELKRHVSDRDKAGGLGVARPMGWLQRAVRPLPPPPLDWLYAGAIARQAGMAVTMLDALGQGLTAEQTRRAVCSLDAQMIGVRLSLPSLDADLALAQSLSTALPNARVFVFGACIQTTLAEWGQPFTFDVLFGEVEALVMPYFSQSTHPAILVLAQHGTPPASWTVLEDLDALPVPAWDLVDPAPYSPTGRRDDMVHYVGTTRGCPKACTMCPYYVHQGAAWRQRSVSSVRQELLALKQLGVRLIQTRDPNISWRKRHLLELFRLLPPDLGFVWHIETDLETLEEADLFTLQQAGVKRILTGVESVDAAVLKDVGQNQGALRRVLANMRVCERLGIEVTGFFMIGAPSESWATIQNTLAVASDLPCTYSVSLMTPYRGTAMREQVLREGLLHLPERFQDQNGYRALVRTKYLARWELALALRWVSAELAAHKPGYSTRVETRQVSVVRRIWRRLTLYALRGGVVFAAWWGRMVRKRSPWFVSAS